MENGLNYMAVAFGMQLVQRYCVDDKHNSQISEVSKHFHMWDVPWSLLINSSSVLSCEIYVLAVMA